MDTEANNRRGEPALAESATADNILTESKTSSSEPESTPDDSPICLTSDPEESLPETGPDLAEEPGGVLDSCEDMAPVTLAEPKSTFQRYPALVATLAVIFVVALQAISNPDLLFSMNWLFLGGLWVFYYAIGKLGNILGLLPRKKFKFLIAKNASKAMNLTLSASGLEWHLSDLPHGDNNVPWSSVHLVAVHKGTGLLGKKSASTLLVLNCDEQPDYTINLSRLSASKVEQLFRWFSRKVPQTRLSPEALYLQMQSLYGNQSASIESFTKFWSEDFDRKFELANHVCLSPGQRCGNNRYTIEMVVATKINSSVYLVTDSSGQRFILKELVVPVGTEDSLHGKMLEQFSREANLLSQIKHQSIVTVRDHFVENGRSYLALDCVQGTNLRHYIQLHGSLSESLVIELGKQIADVLHYLSSHNPPIIHRDLTPDNIVYGEAQSEIVVVDFGAANIYATEGTGTLIGKQGYMPPEQFKGKTTPASDVYAFGSTLLFLLTGSDPPGMGRLPASLPTIGSELLKLIEDCLDLDGPNRPTSEDILDRLASIEEQREKI